MKLGLAPLTTGVTRYDISDLAVVQANNDDPYGHRMSREALQMGPGSEQWGKCEDIILARRRAEMRLLRWKRGTR